MFSTIWFQPIISTVSPIMPFLYSSFTLYLPLCFCNNCSFPPVCLISIFQLWYHSSVKTLHRCELPQKAFNEPSGRIISPEDTVLVPLWTLLFNLRYNLYTCHCLDYWNMAYKSLHDLALPIPPVLDPISVHSINPNLLVSFWFSKTFTSRPYMDLCFVLPQPLSSYHFSSHFYFSFRSWIKVHSSGQPSFPSPNLALPLPCCRFIWYFVLFLQILSQLV